MSKESAMAVATGSSPAPSASAPTVAAPQSNLSVVPPQPPELPSAQFSQLAKRESEILRERQSLKTEREAIAAEKAKYEPIAQKYSDYLKQKETDPVAAMKTLGFSETDIFNFMAASQPVEVTPEQRAAQAAEAAAEAKIKEFEETQKQRALSQQKESDDAVVRVYRADVSKVIASDPVKFEYSNYHGPEAEALAYETALACAAKSDGKDVPTALEVAEMVENYYEEQDKAMNGLKKRQPKEAPAPVQQTSRNPQRTRTISSPADTLKPGRTLGSNATTTVASLKPSVTHETFTQKRERLIEKLRNGG